MPWTTKEDDIDKDRLGMEWKLPESFGKARGGNKRRYIHETLWWNQTIVLETDASGVGWVAGPLQTRDGTGWSQDEAPNNIILRPIEFQSMRLKTTKR